MARWKTIVLGGMFVGVAGALLTPATSVAGGGSILFSENFDGLALGPPKEEVLNLGTPCDQGGYPSGCWSPTGPAGWTVDNSNLPAGGVTEWRGFTWANPGWWDAVAGQDRANFFFGTGDVVMIADSDEWDDDPHDPGIFDSNVSSPSISLAGIAANSATLSFDSSWRTESKQTATMTASYNGGTPEVILRWESQETIVQGDMDRDDDVDFDDISAFVLGLNNPGEYENQFFLPPGVQGDTDSDQDLDFDDIGNSSSGFVGILAGNVTPADVSNPNFKPDSDTEGNPISNPETVNIALNNPANANMVLNLHYTGDNNWWWATDNYDVSGPGGSVYSEDFEGVTLQANVDEDLLDEFQGEIDPNQVHTATPPANWTVDRSGVPGNADPPDTNGVEDWIGWNFVDPTFWTAVAGDQNRSFYTLGQNVIAVADPDEWDDSDHPDGTYNTDLDSPAIDLTGVDPNSVEIQFDSSWRDEDDQKVALLVSFDGGNNFTELFRWTSDPGDPDFKDDAENETLIIPVNNPSGGSMIIRWSMFEAGNDWWWAVDNIEVRGTTSNNFAVPEPTSMAMVVSGGLAGLLLAVRRRRSPRARRQVT